MRKLKVIVVDDESLSRSYLVSILSHFKGVEVVAQCSNGKEALKVVNQLTPDLAFLDIEMPGLTGFDVVKALHADVLPMVIFATAFEAYAVEAFDLQAVDYVLKPFDPVRIERAIERAQEKILTLNKGDKSHLVAAIDQLSSSSKQADGPHFYAETSKLAIKDGGETVLVPFEEIDWIDAAGDYMCVHVGTKTYVLRCTMRELEQKLLQTSLVRIHRSTLANLERVNSISNLPKGEYQLHLDNDVVLKVSRSYRQSINYLLS